MKFITGHDRSQTTLFPISLDQAIDQDNEVRLIDLFVDSLPLEKFGFDMLFVENGRPAYHPSELLKIYIYGYLNKIRSLDKPFQSVPPIPELLGSSSILGKSIQQWNVD